MKNFKFFIGNTGPSDALIKWSRGFGTQLNEITANAMEYAATYLIAHSSEIENCDKVTSLMFPTLYRIFSDRTDERFTRESLMEEIMTIMNLLNSGIPMLTDLHFSFPDIDFEIELVAIVSNQYIVQRNH